MLSCVRPANLASSATLPNLALSGSTRARTAKNPPTSTTRVSTTTTPAAHFTIRSKVPENLFMSRLVLEAGSQGFQIGQQGLLVAVGQIGPVAMSLIGVAGQAGVVQPAITLGGSARPAGVAAIGRIEKIIASVEGLRP